MLSCPCAAYRLYLAHVSVGPAAGAADRVALYILLLRRRKKGALRYGNLALVRQAPSASPAGAAMCRPR